MKVQLVDASDQPIGAEEYSDVDFSKVVYRVTGLWIRNSKGQALLAQRSLEDDNDAGRWGPAVAGTVAEGETYDDNIYKEAVEEIGLEGVQFTKGPKVYYETSRQYFCQWYFALVDRPADEFTRAPEEVNDLAWIDESQLKQELLTNPEKYLTGMWQSIKYLDL